MNTLTFTVNVMDKNTLRRKRLKRQKICTSPDEWVTTKQACQDREFLSFESLSP